MNPLLSFARAAGAQFLFGSGGCLRQSGSRENAISLDGETAFGALVEAFGSLRSTCRVTCKSAAVLPATLNPKAAISCCWLVNTTVLNNGGFASLERS